MDKYWWITQQAVIYLQTDVRMAQQKINPPPALFKDALNFLIIIPAKYECVT